MEPEVVALVALVLAVVSVWSPSPGLKLTGVRFAELSVGCVDAAHDEAMVYFSGEGHGLLPLVPPVKPAERLPNCP
jgi:hypothetical protein